MVRVLIAVESAMLGELLKDLIDREPNMDVVGKVSDPMDALLAVEETQADVLIHTWPESGRMPGICEHLLNEYPDLLVIGIAPNQDRAYACRRAITTTTLLTAGLQDVLSEIRLIEPALR